MPEPTREDVDALVGPATPHFAYQLRARVEELIRDLPDSHPVKQYGLEQMELLDRLGYASSKAEEGRARAALAARLGRAPELGARVRPAPAPVVSRRRPRGPRDRRDARNRQGDRASLRHRSARGRSRSAICATTPPPRRQRRSSALRAPSPCSCAGNVASQTRDRTEFASHGPYDVVVHNAATGVIRAALETEDKHWDWTLGANARALLSLARACAPDMKPGSSIVGVSSLGSTRVLENYVLVGTSKAALESVVRYLAVELAPRGIRVNAVSAGVVETEALDHFPNREADAAGSEGAHARRTDGRA